MKQHEATSAAEHLRMMAKRNATIESKVTMVTAPTVEELCRRVTCFCFSSWTM